jgi:hypothetical protein
MGKTSLQNELLPHFPEGLNNARITIIDNKGVLYLGALSEGSLIIYILNRNAAVVTRWEELARTDIDTKNQILMSFQSNGMDDCLFVFVSDSEDGLLRYNLRLGNWVEKDIDTNSLAQASCAFSQGASHIVFLDKNGHSLYLFNTITDTFNEMRIKPAEGVLKKVQFFGNQMSTIYYDETNQSLQLRYLSVEKVKNGFSPTDIIVLVLYFGVLVFIGYYFSRRQKNSEDYFKGGQRIPWWAAGLSLFGTSLSAITFMAIPAKAYATNWSYMLFNSGILMVAPIIMFVFIPFFRKLNITTAYEYLEVRFNALIRVICSLAFIVFQVGRMGVILLLPSIAINLVTGF